MTKKIYNGVNVDELFNKVSAIEDDEALAKFNFRIKNDWHDAGYSVSTIEDFSAGGVTYAHKPAFVISNGQHPYLLSHDEGPSPVETVLHALAGCLTTALVYHASTVGIILESVTSYFDGDLDLKGFLGLDNQARAGYDKITVSFDVASNASQVEIEELIEIAKNRSPLFDIISNPVHIDVKLDRFTHVNTKPKVTS